jgi:hypothetical protein
VLEHVAELERGVQPTQRLDQRLSGPGSLAPTQDRGPHPRQYGEDLRLENGLDLAQRAYSAIQPTQHQDRDRGKENTERKTKDRVRFWLWGNQLRRFRLGRVDLLDTRDEELRFKLVDLARKACRLNHCRAAYPARGGV